MPIIFKGWWDKEAEFTDGLTEPWETFTLMVHGAEALDYREATLDELLEAVASMGYCFIRPETGPSVTVDDDGTVSGPFISNNADGVSAAGIEAGRYILQRES